MFFNKLIKATVERPVYSGNLPGPTFFSSFKSQDPSIDAEKMEDRGYEQVLGLVPVHK